jgi:hypothetical protein
MESEGTAIKTGADTPKKMFASGSSMATIPAARQAQKGTETGY